MNMVRSIEKLKKMKEEKDHSLSNLCCVSPSSPFHSVITNPSSNKIAHNPLALILSISFMWKEKELMDDLSASKSETRKLKIYLFTSITFN